MRGVQELDKRNGSRRSLGHAGRLLTAWPLLTRRGVACRPTPPPPCQASTTSAALAAPASSAPSARTTCTTFGA